MDDEGRMLELLERKKDEFHEVLDRYTRQLVLVDTEHLDVEDLRKRLNIVRGFFLLRARFDRLIADFANGRRTLEETNNRLVEFAVDLALQWKHASGIPLSDLLSNKDSNDETE